MLESLQNYTKLCDTVGREPDCAEFMAWTYLRIEPDWYKELINVQVDIRTQSIKSYQG